MLSLKILAEIIQSLRSIHLLRITFKPQIIASTERNMAPKNAQEGPSIAILGAGIGGLALAIGLSRQKIPCTIYEAASEFSAIGAGVGLGPNALLAMNLIDPSFGTLYDAIKTGNTSPEKETHVFEVMMDEPGLGEKRGWKGAGVGAEYFRRTSAHRKALLDVMTSLLDRDVVQVKFSKRAVAVVPSEDADGVRITFADGEIIQADAVIGCDGVKGITRQAVLGSRYPELVQPTYTHIYSYRSIVPMQICQDILGSHAGDSNMFMGNGRNLVIYPVTNGKEVNFVWFVNDDNPWLDERITLECTKAEMMEDLKGVDDRLLRFTEVSLNTAFLVSLPDHEEFSTSNL